MAEAGKGFGLYVHWPFCQAKCPYCDFNSHVSARIDQPRWARALAREVTRVASLTGERTLTSVFFGGGTPSTMEAETVHEILSAIRRGWTCDDDLEVTLEANPTSVEAGRFHGFREAGVTRISLGVQALNDEDLRRLGRLHTVAEARAAFDVARDLFDRVSFDLICARQDQTLDAWRAELDDALAMAVDHLSLYQLTIEPGTAFARRHAHGKLTGLPDEDLGADLYELTVERCAAAGLELYEISNFARPGAECRHNLLYWSGGDYAGIGPGAHGRLTLSGQRYATEQISAPLAWLTAAEREDGAHETRASIPKDEQFAEYVLMGLRKRDGIDLGLVRSLAPDWRAVEERAAGLADLALLSQQEQRLVATDKGRLVLDGIIGELLAE